jgi:hypothetical protein
VTQKQAGKPKNSFDFTFKGLVNHSLEYPKNLKLTKAKN